MNFGKVSLTKDNTSNNRKHNEYEKKNILHIFIQYDNTWHCGIDNRFCDKTFSKDWQENHKFFMYSVEKMDKND